MPPDLADVLLLSIANPAAVGVGYFLGRRADQPQKSVVAGIVAGVAGVLFAWLLMLTGLFEPKIRLLGGVFVLSAMVGVACAWLGFMARRWREGS